MSHPVEKYILTKELNQQVEILSCYTKIDSMQDEFFICKRVKLDQQQVESQNIFQHNISMCSVYELFKFRVNRSNFSIPNH